MVGNRKKARLLAGVFVCALSACATMPQTQELRRNALSDIPLRVELADVPFYPQQDYQCGPASLAAALTFAGVDTTAEALVEQVYVPHRRGSLQAEMLAATRRQGLVAYELAPRFESLLREIAAGTPVIVLQNRGPSWHPLWHYALAIGYDLSREELVLRSGVTRREVMLFTRFEFAWKDADYWAMIAIPPERLPATASEEQYASAAVALEKSAGAKTAKIAYGTLLGRWQQSLAGNIGLGNTAHQLGQLAEAEAAFRRASEDHPQSAAAFNNLAQTLADQGNLDEALSAARRAVSLGGPLSSVTRATLDEIIKKQANADSHM
jgi:tetratricopeptide (TPR) repeat protein